MAGALGAFLVAPELEKLLFKTSARDSTHFLVAAAVLGGAALAVSLVTGHPAATVEPLEALRAES